MTPQFSLWLTFCFGCAGVHVQHVRLVKSGWSVKSCQFVCHKHWDQAASDSMLCKSHGFTFTLSAGDVKLTGQTQAALQAEQDQQI